MKFNWKEPMIVWCRVKGPGNRIRELSSLLDINYAYCLMLRQDAVDLGYSHASYGHGTWGASFPDRAPLIVDMRSIEKTILVTLKEVSLGNLVAMGVDAVVLEFDLPPVIPFDMVLGWSFLKNFKLEVDPKSSSLTLG